MWTTCRGHHLLVVVEAEMFSLNGILFTERDANPNPDHLLVKVQTGQDLNVSHDHLLMAVQTGRDPIPNHLLAEVQTRWDPNPKWSNPNPRPILTLTPNPNHLLLEVHTGWDPNPNPNHSTRFCRHTSFPMQPAIFPRLLTPSTRLTTDLAKFLVCCLVLCLLYYKTEGEKT